MHNFKVGDRVRVINPGGCLRLGQECTIKKVEGSSVAYTDGLVYLEDIYGGWLPSRFELSVSVRIYDTYIENRRIRLRK